MKPKGIVAKLWLRGGRDEWFGTEKCTRNCLVFPGSKTKLEIIMDTYFGPKFYCFAKLQCVCKEGYLLGYRSIHRPTADLETLHAILAVIVVCRGFVLTV